ncbi:orotidine-5'-phosphate decarboxylase [Salipaludibacillus sp. CF4.18]|uniref:orotidine-5'-phosphate decarboxylase n=1 Tax=Salipaludibacillus sp. CF4.18 TaxID=3373081 RepID=UPI003EE63053
MEIIKQKYLFIALDMDSKQEVDRFLSYFTEEKIAVKVGMELFYRLGPSLISELKAQGHTIFLDLKLHDIPTTVERAMKQLARLEVDMVNVHAMGGLAMMRAAKRGLENGTPSGKSVAKIIAVTQLTSTTDNILKHEMAVDLPLDKHVLHLCHQAQLAELDGVVCSALEVPLIKEHCGPSFETVTPGIRLKSDAANDQARVVTPNKARELGSDAIVVGRGITQAKDPLKAYHNYLKEWSN